MRIYLRSGLAQTKINLADDFREKLDLVKLLVRHRASTFFFQIDGVSMVDADMDEGDIIIVDRAVEPYNDCKAELQKLPHRFVEKDSFVAIMKHRTRNPGL